MLLFGTSIEEAKSQPHRTLIVMMPKRFRGNKQKDRKEVAFFHDWNLAVVYTIAMRLLQNSLFLAEAV